MRPYILEDRGRITESIRILVRVNNQTEMFSDHDETSPSIAAVSACSMLAVQQQKRLSLQNSLSIHTCVKLNISGNGNVMP